MNERQYLRKIKQGIRCGQKRRKELLSSIEETVKEKVAQGMSIEEIMVQVGTPDEICDEVNAYLSENGLLVSNKILNLQKLCKSVNYVSILAIAILTTYMFLKQNSILRFVNEHQNASAFFFAAPQTQNIQIAVLIILGVIFLLSLMVLWFLEKR